MNNLLSRPNKISIHKLTHKGVNNFIDTINNIRQHKTKKKKVDESIIPIINSFPEIDGKDTDLFINSPQLDLKIIHPTRFELSKYLFLQLNDFIKENKLVKNPYFWSWLALVYIEDLSDGFKNVSVPHNYVPEMGNFDFNNQRNKLYQHSIREGFLMYRKFGDESKIYFSKMGVGYMGDIWEQIRSRGDFRRHNGMHKYILKKYYDPEGSGFAKKNASADAFEYADSLRNLAPCYLKLSVNYAAPLCEPEDFSKLLGPGFELDN